MGVSDPAITEWVVKHLPLAHWIAPALGAVLVVSIGLLLKKRTLKKGGVN